MLIGKPFLNYIWNKSSSTNIKMLGDLLLSILSASSWISIMWVIFCRRPFWLNRSSRMVVIVVEQNIFPVDFILFIHLMYESLHLVNFKNFKAKAWNFSRYEEQLTHIFHSSQFMWRYILAFHSCLAFCFLLFHLLTKF